AVHVWAEHDLRPPVLNLGPEDELAGAALRHALRETSDASVLSLHQNLPRRADTPSGERPRDLDHVLLCVTAIDAERVQFHELAGVILIQTLRSASSGNRERGTGTRSSPARRLPPRRNTVPGSPFPVPSTRAQSAPPTIGH